METFQETKWSEWSATVDGLTDEPLGVAGELRHGAHDLGVLCPACDDAAVMTCQ